MVEEVGLIKLMQRVRKEEELDRQFRAMGIDPSQFKTKRKEAVGFIYFLQDGHNNIKIGWTKYLEDRRKALMTGSASDLRLLGYVQGTRKGEAAMHSKLKTLRITKEWYRGDANLLEYIRQVKEG